MKTIAITKKDRKTLDGRTFPTYFCKNNVGEYTQVKFLCDAPKFSARTMDITIAEHGASYSVKEVEYTDKSGVTKTATERTLFVKEVASASKHIYVDEWEGMFDGIEQTELKV